MRCNDRMAMYFSPSRLKSLFAAKKRFSRLHLLESFITEYAVYRHDVRRAASKRRTVGDDDTSVNTGTYSGNDIGARLRRGE